MPQDWNEWFSNQVARAYLTAEELRSYHEYLDGKFAMIERRLKYLEEAQMEALKQPEPEPGAAQEACDGGR